MMPSNHRSELNGQHLKLSDDATIEKMMDAEGGFAQEPLACIMVSYIQ